MWLEGLINSLFDLRGCFTGDGDTERDGWFVAGLLELLLYLILELLTLRCLQMFYL